ncbi:hypothetical protein TWF696_004132 [Orbilia brochopaga]|uniref:Uncharacterized protein n=1 Tax=Orbilia brochopaga TaxID=3140254 RepID=A0AAV9V604_9PEZI
MSYFPPASRQPPPPSMGSHLQNQPYVESISEESSFDVRSLDQITPREYLTLGVSNTRHGRSDNNHGVNSGNIHGGYVIGTNNLNNIEKLADSIIVNILNEGIPTAKDAFRLFENSGNIPPEPHLSSRVTELEPDKGAEEIDELISLSQDLEKSGYTGQALRAQYAIFCSRNSESHSDRKAVDAASEVARLIKPREPKKALEWFHAIFETHRKQVGEKHESTILAAKNVAEILTELKRHQLALRWYFEVFTASKRLGSPRELVQSQAMRGISESLEAIVGEIGLEEFFDLLRIPEEKRYNSRPVEGMIPRPRTGGRGILQWR